MLTERNPYITDPEREHLALTERGVRGPDIKPRNISAALLASMAHARAAVTSDGLRSARMALTPERRAEIARKAARARWQQQREGRQG
jgi:hypothetical protein